MLENVYSLQKQLQHSSLILEALAEQIPQARFDLQTASRLEIEYRSSFRAFLHKLTGKQEEECARLSREKRLAEGTLNRLIQQRETESDRLETLKEELARLPSWETLSTEENRRQWAERELSLCAQLLLPRLDSLEEAIAEYRRMLRGEIPMLSIAEQQEISATPIRTVEKQKELLLRLKNALEILGNRETIPEFFRNPPGFLAAAARHNQLERAAQAEDQIRQLRKLLSQHQ